MKVEYPLAQPFGMNYNGSYLASGLKGHTGIDEAGGYGCTYHSKFDQEYVYKILDADHPANDGSGFTGVFTIIDNGIECFEFLYGHGDPLVKAGQILHKGDPVMTEANHGEVYSGATRITLDMQKAGDKRGAHAHNQKRILRKDKVLVSNTRYITDNSGGYLFYNGFFYAIPYFDNGYNGCVDWMAPVFSRTLTLGMSGYDVICLQNFLKARNFFNGDSTGYYGKITMQAVSAFQKANNLSPILGIFGPKTKDLVNSILQ
jgi:hypothetical protein